MARMSHEQTAKQLMDALPSDKRPRVPPRTCRRNYVEDLAWSRLGILLEELPLVQEIGKLGDPNSRCFTQNPKRTSGQREIH